MLWLLLLCFLLLALVTGLAVEKLQDKIGSVRVFYVLRLGTFHNRVHVKWTIEGLGVLTRNQPIHFRTLRNLTSLLRLKSISSR